MVRVWTPGVRETRVEQELTRQVKQRSGMAIKILPSVKGLPDRLVLMPGGRAFFVELKSPAGRLELAQIVVHRTLDRLGFPVAVLPSPAAVRAWVATALDARHTL